MSVPPPAAAAASGPSTDPSDPPASPPLLPLPPLDVRWVHAGAQHLDLLPNPITTVSTTYKAFSFDESEHIEDAWQALAEEERAQAIREWGIAEGEGAPGKKDKDKETTDKDKAKDKDGKEKDEHKSKGRYGHAENRAKSSVADDGRVHGGEKLSSHHPIDAIPVEKAEDDNDVDDDGRVGGVDDLDEGDRNGDYFFGAGRRGSVPDEEILRSGEEQKDAEEPEGGDGHAGPKGGANGGGPDSPTTRYKRLVGEASKDYDNLEEIRGVPVSQDSLFEVHLPTLSLHPVFWAHTGPRVSVLRGTWFVGDETRPCSWELGEEIEKGYLEIQPWQPSYKHELATAISQGPAAEEKLKYSLPARFGQGLGVIFEDDGKGRLITTGTLTYLSRAFWASLRAKPSGTYVYRGYAAARAASGKEKDDVSGGRRSGSHSRRGSTASARSNSISHAAGGERPVSGFFGKAMREKQDGKGENGAQGSPSIVGGAMRNMGAPEHHAKRADDAVNGVKSGVEGIVKASRERRVSIVDRRDRTAMEEENAPLVEHNEGDTPCTDLILVVHGIGQQLASTYEAYNFVYAGNQLRQVLRKQAANPALSSIIRDRRVQVLPVQWRASLKLENEKTAEDREHGMDNRFTMSDITINRSIPYVRELTNAVLLDIPLFMSHHRQKMIEAVCVQANRLYRLWMARNPDFEKNGGRVHIIGHSLGSALCAHILSNQPTRMPPMAQLPQQVITQTKDRFLFNTSNYFMVGSPLGIFLHLDQAQLMPRKGRERTMYSPQDEALERPGKFGCMSIDSLYNVFYYTDPVAYQLNAAVDVQLSKKRTPLAITSVTAPFYATVTEGFGSISKYLPTYLGGKAEGSSGNEKKLLRPGAIRLPSGIEMLGPSGEERLEGSRGDRRFSALNPHGNVDFYLPSAGVSEYLDMITSHASYWSDASFAAFLLAETFSTRLDQMRTGMGLAQKLLPDGVIV